MGEIATSNRALILFYNPNSIIGKQVLAYAKAEGYAVRDVDILKTPFTGTQLEELADKLHLKIDGLVNKEHPDFKTHFEYSTFSDDDWIKIMRKNPHLIKEPIVLLGDKTIHVNTPSDILKL
ncbi:arsenate reductase family protein [Winogradskyella psychrotolerans]|nr:ArsC/Spx/MgsR family protein [Winogradskyella psychrotolerans]